MVTKILKLIDRAALLALFLILGGILAPKLFGYQPYAIISGSMEPKMPVGSVVYAKKVPFSDLKEGDAITFVLNEQLTVATHRITGIDTEKEQFTTKGDANEQEDAKKVSYKNVIGKVTACIPYIGYVVAFTSSIKGKAALFSAFLFLILFDAFLDIWEKGDGAVEEA